MRYAAVLIAAVVLSSPLCAEQLPDDDPYAQAVAARLRGEPAEAVRLLEPLVAARARNTDALVQLGYAYLALGRLDDAARAFHAAIEIAPAYADARLGLAWVRQRLGDRRGALQELAELPPGNVDADELRAQIKSDTSTATWFLDTDIAYTAVNRGQSDWTDFAIQMRHRLSQTNSLTGRSEVSRRFGETDTYFEGMVDHTVNARARVYLLFGGTPGADFRPRWQGATGGSLRVRGGAAPSVVTLDMRRAKFVTGNVGTIAPGLEQYLAGGRAWLTARWVNTFANGRHLSGYLLRGDVQASGGVRVFGGFSNAPDTTEGMVVETRSFFGGATADLTKHLTARLSATYDKSASGARRRQLGLGFGWRF